MMRYLKWALVVAAILIGAWAISTLLQVVAITQESKLDRKNLNTEVNSLKADNKQLQEGLDEANRRCDKAKNCTPVTPPTIVVEGDDDPEIQEPEIDDPDPDDPEKQDPEIQDPEIGDNETQDPEINDPDPDDPEKQDEEIQDPEIQDPEIDDPDPASPYDFTFVFTVNGPGPPQVYSITCNSGTGQCVTTPQ